MATSPRGSCLMSQPRFRGSAGNGAQELVAFRVGQGTLSAAPGSSAAGNGFSLSSDGGATLLRRSSNSNPVGQEKGPAYPGVVKAPADSDHLLSVHRRKMLRRAANRRSAQLSRARKKVGLALTPRGKLSQPSLTSVLSLSLLTHYSTLRHTCKTCSRRIFDCRELWIS